MSKTIVSLTAALALASLGTVPARAAETGTVHGVKTVGALTFETQGLATDTYLVQRQGGFAVPSSVQWIKTPTDAVHTRQAAF